MAARAAARARAVQDEILRLYLRLAPFGGNLEGVRAASLAYFGKEPRRLSLGEAALLVALPQSPEVRRPDRNPRSGAARARPRAGPRRRGGCHHAAEAETRQGRAHADERGASSRCWRRTWPKPRWRRTRPSPFIALTHRPRPAGEPRGARARAEPNCSGEKLSAAMIAVDHTPAK